MQDLHSKGFLEKTSEALAGEPAGRFLLLVAAHQNDRNIGPDLTQFHERRRSVHVRHRHVEKDRVDLRVRLEQFDARTSIDGGEHWLKMNNDSLPTLAVDDLVQHPREMDLVVGTHGRSIYVLDDVSALSQLSREVLDSELHAFKIPDAKPRLFLPYAGLWGDRMFMAKNPPMGARITYWIRDYSGDEVSVTITNTAGTKVRKLTGTNRPGLNRVVWDLQLEEYDRLSNLDEWLRQTQFAPPGEYIATITCGERKAKRKFVVLPGPGAATD